MCVFVLVLIQKGHSTGVHSIFVKVYYPSRSFVEKWATMEIIILYCGGYRTQRNIAAATAVRSYQNFHPKKKQFNTP